MRKDLAVPRRGLSSSCPQPLRHRELKQLSHQRYNRLYVGKSISSPKLAATVAEILQLEEKARHEVIMECSPGRGILTKALLETGASVIALESQKNFIPHLKSLDEKRNGKLKVVHCDFFKMDPSNCNTVKPPIMLSQELFPTLGIKANSWLEDTPFKIVGMFPINNEIKALWKLLHDLYTCSSIFSYGRVEVYMFISENQFEKLIAGPTKPELYHVLSVLWQLSCEMKLLLQKVPLSLFEMYTRDGLLVQKTPVKPQNQCFIQMIPRKDLFTEYLTPINYDIFFHMMKQCFGRRSALLIQHLHSLTPCDPLTIMNKAKIKASVKPSDIYPQDFKRLFKAIECSSDDDSKWLYDRVTEEVRC